MGDSFERLNSSIRYLFSSSLGRRGDDDEAESEALWERLLPTDHMQILSRAVDPVEHSSKKELYFRLHQPLLLDHGTKSFRLDMATGKKCYMLSARELGIVLRSNHRYWRWINHPDSRFSEVSEFLNVCWLEIIGKIDASVLSKRTTYTAYLIFKIASMTYNLHYPPHEASIRVGSYSSKELLCLDPSEESSQEGTPVYRSRNPAVNRQVPRTRADGWMEIFLGEFFNDGLTEGEVQISLLETKGGQWKARLIVEGIELRPKVEADASMGWSIILFSICSNCL